eukprot:3860648-Rhodomonas_salina.1
MRAGRAGIDRTRGQSRTSLVCCRCEARVDEGDLDRGCVATVRVDHDRHSGLPSGFVFAHGSVSQPQHFQVGKELVSKCNVIASATSYGQEGGENGEVGCVEAFADGKYRVTKGGVRC